MRSTKIENGNIMCTKKLSGTKIYLIFITGNLLVPTQCQTVLNKKKTSHSFQSNSIIMIVIIKMVTADMRTPKHTRKPILQLYLKDFLDGTLS